MKLYFLLISLLFSSNFISAQTDTVNYLDYHKKMISIEETYTNEDFEKADSLYTSLFCDYDPPFLSDVIIALQISILANNLGHSKELLELAYLKGATPEGIKQIPLTKKLPEFIWVGTMHKYKLLREKYLCNIDTCLLRQFTNRYKNEQEQKNSTNGWNVIKNNIRFIHLAIKLKGNYPGEKMIGIDDLNYKYFRFSSRIVAVTLYHYSYGFTEFENILENALKKGYLHPRTFAWFYNGEKIARKERYGDYKKPNAYRPPFPKYNFNFLFDYYSNNLEKVNSDRAMFGICSYETDSKKLQLEKKYGLELMIMQY